MNRLKGINITALFIILLISNLIILAEGVLGIFAPNLNYHFTGNRATEIADSEMGTLAIAADKMNVFYIGVDNPITVAASGVKSENLLLTTDRCKINLAREGHYYVNCYRPGKMEVIVTNKITGESEKVVFRVKRVPDPVVRLAKKTGGWMISGEFRAQSGLRADLDNFDMDLKCRIQSYNLDYICNGCEPIELRGIDGDFTEEILAVVRQARPGDRYVFRDVKVRCPGDVVRRRVNELSFKIK